MSDAPFSVIDELINKARDFYSKKRETEKKEKIRAPKKSVPKPVAPKPEKKLVLKTKKRASSKSPEAGGYRGRKDLKEAKKEAKSKDTEKFLAEPSRSGSKKVTEEQASKTASKFKEKGSKLKQAGADIKQSERSQKRFDVAGKASGASQPSKGESTKAKLKGKMQGVTSKVSSDPTVPKSNVPSQKKMTEASSALKTKTEKKTEVSKPSTESSKPKTESKGSGVNVMGAYQTGTAVGQSTAAPAGVGGAGIVSTAAHRAVAGIHGALNSKTSATKEAQRGQREAQIQRQTASGTVSKGVSGRVVTIRTGIKRIGNG